MAPAERHNLRLFGILFYMESQTNIKNCKIMNEDDGCHFQFSSLIVILR